MSILGRIYIEDTRDKKFPMKKIIEKAPEPPEEVKRDQYRYWWADGWWGDQWYTSQCVAYSWLHWLEDGPLTHFPRAPQREAQYITGAVMDPNVIYTEAQKVDEWPGEDYEGTSVRAGAKILQRNGYISSYGWAWDVETVVQALLTAGPVVVGTNWYESMFYPSADGKMTVEPHEDAYGHAYLLNGVNVNDRIIRVKNSWGRSWGKDGFGYISFDDMDHLIKNYGEACIAEEIVKDAQE